MAVYFSGRPMAPSEVHEALEAAGAAGNGRFKFNKAHLDLCRFYLKPPTNLFHTTSGNNIYLGSNWKSLSTYDQAKGLLHESAHSISQVQQGLGWWMFKYIASPWTRLDDELEGLNMEIQWDLVQSHLLPPDFAAYAASKAADYVDFYTLWPISYETIRVKILNLIQLQYHLITGR